MKMILKNKSLTTAIILAISTVSLPLSAHANEPTDDSIKQLIQVAHVLDNDNTEQMLAIEGGTIRPLSKPNPKNGRIQ